MSGLGQTFLMGQANGQADPGATLWDFGRGASDAGNAIVVLAKTDWISPVGPRLEAVFKFAYVTVRSTMGVRLELVIEIDRRPSTETITPGTLSYMVHAWDVLPHTDPETETFVIPLRKKFATSDREWRYFPQGTRARLKLRTPDGIATGVLSIEGFSVDVDPVEESKEVPS